MPLFYIVVVKGITYHTSSPFLPARLDTLLTILRIQKLDNQKLFWNTSWPDSQRICLLCWCHVGVTPRVVIQFLNLLILMQDWNNEKKTAKLRSGLAFTNTTKCRWQLLWKAFNEYLPSEKKSCWLECRLMMSNRRPNL